MSLDVDFLSVSGIDGTWCLLESKRPKKEQPLPRQQFVTTVPTTVIEDYDKDIPQINKNEPIPTKEFVQEAASTSSSASAQNNNGNGSWFYYMITSLSSWLVAQNDIAPLQPKTIDTKPEKELLWNEWEWVLSKTEEFAMRQTTDDASRIKQELLKLRQSAKLLQFKSYFHNVEVSPTFALLQRNPVDARNLATELDASKISKIIADVITQKEDSWLKFIGDTFFSEPELQQKWEQFQNNYKEKPYERNVVGSLKELAFSAACGLKNVGMTEKVLVDILWSMWKSLTEVIRTAVGTELTQEQLELVAQTVSQVKDPLIHLWIETVRNSRYGRSKEGQLVEKWKQDKQQEEQRLLKIKQKGVDARYEYIPHRPVQPEPIANKPHAVDISSLRKILEQSLAFPVQVK